MEAQTSPSSLSTFISASERHLNHEDTASLQALLIPTLYRLRENPERFVFKSSNLDMPLLSCPLETPLMRWFYENSWNKICLVKFSMHISMYHSSSGYPLFDHPLCDHSSFNLHTPCNPSLMIFTVCGLYRHHVKPWLPSWRNTFRRGHGGHG